MTAGIFPKGCGTCLKGWGNFLKSCGIFLKGCAIWICFRAILSGSISISTPKKRRKKGRGTGEAALLSFPYTDGETGHSFVFCLVVLRLAAGTDQCLCIINDKISQGGTLCG